MKVILEMVNKKEKESNIIIIMVIDYHDGKPIRKHVMLTRNDEVKINNY